jgi:hypothetical protein
VLHADLLKNTYFTPHAGMQSVTVQGAEQTGVAAAALQASGATNT